MRGKSHFLKSLLIMTLQVDLRVIKAESLIFHANTLGVLYVASSLLEFSLSPISFPFPNFLRLLLIDGPTHSWPLLPFGGWWC